VDEPYNPAGRENINSYQHLYKGIPNKKPPATQSREESSSFVYYSASK
jgi:hypothetical protein